MKINKIYFWKENHLLLLEKDQFFLFMKALSYVYCEVCEVIAFAFAKLI